MILNASWNRAEGVRLALIEEIEKLSNMPSANGIIPKVSEGNLIFRRRIKWNYRIIFTIEEDEKLVFVVAIDNIRRDPQKLLEELKF